MKRHWKRNGYMLKGKLRKKGYDWWWHNLIGIHKKTGEKVPFFIQYMIVNPDLSPREAVLGQLETNKRAGKMPSYALMRVGRWGRDKKHILKFYPSDSFKADRKILDVTIAGNRATEYQLTGSVLVTREEVEKQKEYNADWGEMSWDLNADKELAYSVGYGASGPMRFLEAFAMYWHVQGMKVKYEGTITLDGEIYDVLPDVSYGYQDKNWGSDYTNPWIWIGCNNFTSEKTGEKLGLTSLDVGGGAPVVFGKKLRGRLLIAFALEGKIYEYNFSKFWTGSKEQFTYEETDELISWHIEANKRNSRIVIDFHCPKEEMIRLDPEGPEGQRNHSDLHNGGTGKGTVELYEKAAGKWELVDRFKGEDAGCELGK